MAFGGVQVNNTPGVASANAPVTHISGITLAARVGAPDATGAAADSGVLTTGTPGANQNQIPANFGRGAGNWVAGDDLLHVTIAGVDTNPDGAGPVAAISHVHSFSTSIVAGNLVIAFHNKGAVASTGIDLTLIFG